MTVLCLRTKDLRKGDIFFASSCGYTCYRILDTHVSRVACIGSTYFRVEKIVGWHHEKLVQTEEVIDFATNWDWLVIREETR
jgi:hypothetical protein